MTPSRTGFEYPRHEARPPGYRPVRASAPTRRPARLLSADVLRLVLDEWVNANGGVPIARQQLCVAARQRLASLPPGIPWRAAALGGEPLLIELAHESDTGNGTGCRVLFTFEGGTLTWEADLAEDVLRLVRLLAVTQAREARRAGLSPPARR